MNKNLIVIHSVYPNDVAVQWQNFISLLALDPCNDVAVPWQNLVGKLKAKRFRQIFEYLDVAAAGKLDLIALALENSHIMETLDSEVRADVEAAARILAKRVAPAGYV